MTPEQILIWAQAAQMLMSAGLMAVAEFRRIWQDHNLTMEEQDAILDRVIANLHSRGDRSRAIAEGGD
jgi:hypothetical protein